MIIAELKKKENIVEYILYIRQLMDIMRANNLEIQKIDEIKEAIKEMQERIAKHEELLEAHKTNLNELRKEYGLIKTA